MIGIVLPRRQWPISRYRMSSFPVRRQSVLFIIRTPCFRRSEIRTPLVFGQNYLRKHDFCQKLSRLRRDFLLKIKDLAKILENKGVLILWGLLIRNSTDNYVFKHSPFFQCSRNSLDCSTSFGSFIKNVT